MRDGADATGGDAQHPARATMLDDHDAFLGAHRQGAHETQHVVAGCSLRTARAHRITSAIASKTSLGMISPTSPRASRSRASGMLRTIGTPASSAASRIASATWSSPLALIIGTGQVSRSYSIAMATWV